MTDAGINMENPAPETTVAPPVSENEGLKRPRPARETRAAEELAAMILHDLGKIEGCPKRGVRVTVYGFNAWNAWLSFGVEAGAVPDKADLQGFCDIITERLKRLYDVLDVKREGEP